eukprot:1828215-Amphidinium_carterae.2
MTPNTDGVARLLFTPADQLVVDHQRPPSQGGTGVTPPPPPPIGWHQPLSANPEQASPGRITWMKCSLQTRLELMNLLTAEYRDCVHRSYVLLTASIILMPLPGRAPLKPLPVNSIVNAHLDAALWKCSGNTVPSKLLGKPKILCARK